MFRYVEIVIETTWAASTSYILIPNGFPSVAAASTSLYYEGGGVVGHIYTRKSRKKGIQFTSQLVKHNVVKVHYRGIGDLA